MLVSTSTQKLPLPPFDLDSATLKVRLAEDLWNTRDPEAIAQAYTPDCLWRNRTEFAHGTEAVIALLTRKFDRELNYRLAKELWGFRNNRMAVRFVYESQDTRGQWWRSFGNELWEFNEQGLMQRREASINDYAIEPEDRKLLWELGSRPANHPGLTEMGL